MSTQTAVPASAQRRTTGPLSAWSFPLAIERPEGVRFRHLRAIAAGWLESGLSEEQHRTNAKPFTVSPLIPDDRGGYELVVTTLSMGAAASLAQAAASHTVGSPLRIGGSQAVVVAEPSRVGDGTYAALVATATDQEQVTVTLHSPTMFRSGKHGQNPFPVPTSMLGHYRSRWNTFAPDPLNLDFQHLGLRVVHYEGHSCTVVDGHRRRDGTYADVDYVGFVGEVTFEATTGSPAEHQQMQALCSLAPFCGTGANTTLAMGMTSIQRRGASR